MRENQRPTEKEMGGGCPRSENKELEKSKAVAGTGRN